MKILITALASILPDSGVPGEIVFIPEGESRITPQSHPKGITVNLPSDKGEEIAAKFQQALQKRLGENVKPWLDFEHTRKFPAAGYPTAFRYQPGTGLMMAVDWSGSGRKAIEDKDVRYFSPEFYLGKDGIPSGLPERGPLGGMVTEPAFREIPPVAASDAADPDNPTNQPPKIMKLLLAALNISPDAADAESAAVSAVNALRQTAERVPGLEVKINDLEGKVTAGENALKAERTRQGEDLFARAVAAGLVTKEDEDKARVEYIEAAESGNKLAVRLLAERVEAAEKKDDKQGPSPLSKPLVTGSRDGGVDHFKTGDHAFIVKAKRLVAAKEAEDIDAAMDLVITADASLYDDYCRSLHAD